MSTHTQNEFQETKSALLSYFADSTTAMGARLIGYAVALFTLLQTVQTSGEGKFSRFMPYFPPLVNLDVPVAWKTPLLCILVFFLMTLTVRTVFRYATYMGLCHYLMEVKESDGVEPSQIADMDPMQAAYFKVMNRMVNVKKVKLFGIFPIKFFLTSELYKWENKVGWLISLSFAFILTTFLLWLLW